MPYAILVIQAIVTKQHRQGSLYAIGTYFSQCWRLESEVREPGWLGSGKDALPACRMAPTWQKGERPVGCLFYKASIPLERALPS